MKYYRMDEINQLMIFENMDEKLIIDENDHWISIYKANNICGVDIIQN
jgi:hypothetical protein